MNHLNPGPPQATRPSPTVFCYICGRQFGSKSIAIHEPQCLEKWKVQNKKLPREKRRPLPVKPEAVKTDDGTVDTEATNEILWKAAQGIRVECENCGRKFGEDRLEVHQRSCTAEKPAKAVPRDKSKGRSTSNNRTN